MQKTDLHINCQTSPIFLINTRLHVLFQDREKLNPEEFQASYVFDRSMILLNEFMGIPEYTRINIGITQQDFIKDCSYLGSSCIDVQ